MTRSTRRFDAEVQRRIDAHLDEIEKVLQSAGMSRDERRNVLDNVETQVLEMLAARVQGQPSPEEVSAVIAELDPPESYAAGAREPEAAAAPATRMSRLAVVGAFWGALFFVTRVATSGGGDSGNPLALAIILAGLTGPFGMTILGAVAISEIRDPRNRLHGLGLAFADAVFYPLLVLGAIPLGLAMLVRYLRYRPAPIGEGSNGLVVAVTIFAAALVAWAVLGWLFARWAWRVATRRSDGQ